MERWMRAAVCSAVSVLSLAFGGCDFIRWVNVLVPDFQSKQVQGVWIWSSPGVADPFSHDLQIPVQTLSQGGEPGLGAPATVVDSSGRQQTVLIVAQSDPSNSDGAIVKIGLAARTPSVYVKVTTYNVAGESLLSDAETTF